MDYLKRSWVEIDLNNLLENFDQIKNFAKDRYIMPVIKADGYGHGANHLAQIYEKHGAEMFAVSNINEAIKLRKNGISRNILILGYTPFDSINDLHRFNLTQAIFSNDYAKMLSNAAYDNNVIVKAHLKIDTGMCRIGYNCRTNEHLNDSMTEIINTLSLKNLDFEGIFTHYSSADSFSEDDVRFTDNQYNLFKTTVLYLKNNGFDFKYIHCCNSAASTTRSNTEGNLIRPGIILYGLPASYKFDHGFNLKPVMSIKSIVSMIKQLDKNDCISYGRTYSVEKPITVATLPIGYADGFPRALSNKGKVIVNGKFANILGRVCMDQIVVDITDIDDVSVGTIATVIGHDEKLCITADDIAQICGTISYEILTNISVRMPRVYIKDGKVVEATYLGGEI